MSTATDSAPAPAPEATPNASTGHNYKFDITMSCSGCSGAVERVLKKMDGIESFEVSLPDQTATIQTTDGDTEYDAVLEKIKKTGKKVNKGWVDGVEKDV